MQPLSQLYKLGFFPLNNKKAYKYNTEENMITFLRVDLADFKAIFYVWENSRENVERYVTVVDKESDYMSMYAFI